MAAAVYILCTISCLACAILLWRGFLTTRLDLLYWSASCFFILALGNFLLTVDLVLLPRTVDLSVLRSLITLCAFLVLLYGLIFKSNTP